MKRIIVLTTGGTIAMRADAQAGGAIPQLGANDFFAALPRDLANIEFVEFSNLPSAHLSLEHLWNLSRRIAAFVADETVVGVVVTHGTDTLEESAYLCDITIDTAKPIVFTGAMRTASELGYDGTANIASAIQVVASEATRGLGVLVLFNDTLYAARDVTKTHTTALDTFQSPEWGALGRVDYAGIVIARKPTQREFIPAMRLETNVHLLKLVVGMNAGLFDYLVEKVEAKGIVIEGLGGGRVPPSWLPTIARATMNQVAVVVTSRVGTGRTVDRYGYVGAHRDLVKVGCWFTEGLSGPKARLKLMATLATSEPARFWARA